MNPQTRPATRHTRDDLRRTNGILADAPVTHARRRRLPDKGRRPLGVELALVNIEI